MEEGPDDPTNTPVTLQEILACMAPSGRVLWEEARLKAIIFRQNQVLQDLGQMIPTADVAEENDRLKEQLAVLDAQVVALLEEKHGVHSVQPEAAAGVSEEQPGER